jgi:uncharacterized protein (DUF488 family)
VLFTAGYQGRSLPEFLAALEAAGIEQVIDVRRNALSRKRGFSKRALAEACSSKGIAYVHVPELGVASELRKHLDSEQEYAQLFETYTRDLLPLAAHFVETTAGLIRDMVSAVVCFERDVTMCHRGPLAEVLARSTGFAVRHI